MSEKILSVVIPAYNVEKYLPKCLESFCIPELSNVIEVLIINDGSTDTSPLIAKQFVEKYPGIFRLITKNNGGHGSAINIGVSNAIGTYMKVVDGDDWVNIPAFYRLVSFLKTCSCDIVASRYCWVEDLTQKIRVPKNQFPCRIQKGKCYAFAHSNGNSFLKMHNLTIRTQILKERCPPIDENCFYVDNEFILFPIPYIKSIIWLSDIVYMYRIGMASQSVNLLTMQQRVLQHEKVLSRLLSYYDDTNSVVTDLKVKRYLSSGIARMLCSQIKIYLSFPPCALYKEKIYELETHVKKEHPQVYVAITNQYIWLLRMSNYKLYYLASLILRKSSGII